MDFITIKAIDEWKLDVLSVPFNKPDSDQQTFDERTDYMLGTFNSPAVLYHHGVEPGKKSLQKKPIIIGKTESVDMRLDGIHLIVQLDRTLEWAKRVWEAAKNGMAVASSDSISHLARLEVNGKTIMYEKGRAGRISVWPLAGVSLWDRVADNFQPASRYALALPAMKAIYREAGLPFPDVAEDTDGVAPYADEAAQRARVEAIEARSIKLLEAFKGDGDKK